jgi:hypothetical protein
MRRRGENGWQARLRRSAARQRLCENCASEGCDDCGGDSGTEWNWNWMIDEDLRWLWVWKRGFEALAETG